MRRTLRMLTIALAVGSWLLSAHATNNQSPKNYDGRWWSSADPGERSGFLNGAADCLTSVAHEKWVSRSIEWAVPKITDYYKTHTADNGLPVVDAWRKVLSEAPLKLLARVVRSMQTHTGITTASIGVRVLTWSGGVSCKVICGACGHEFNHHRRPIPAPSAITWKGSATMSTSIQNRTTKP